MSHTVAPAIETACQVEEKVYRVRAPDLLRLAGVGEFDEHINLRSSGFERCGHRYGCAASIAKMTSILTFVHPVLNGAAIGMAVQHLLRRCRVHQKSGSEIQLSIIYFT